MMLIRDRVQAQIEEAADEAPIKTVEHAPEVRVVRERQRLERVLREPEDAVTVAIGTRGAVERLCTNAARLTILLTAFAEDGRSSTEESRCEPLRAAQFAIDTLSGHPQRATRLHSRREYSKYTRRASGIEASEAAVIDSTHVPAVSDLTVRLDDSNGQGHEVPCWGIIRRRCRQAVCSDDAVQPVVGTRK